MPAASNAGQSKGPILPAIRTSDVIEEPRSPVRASYQAPQHFFHFLPLPQGQGSLRPILDFGE